MRVCVRTTFAYTRKSNACVRVKKHVCVRVCVRVYTHSIHVCACACTGGHVVRVCVRVCVQGARGTCCEHAINSWLPSYARRLVMLMYIDVGHQ